MIEIIETDGWFLDRTKGSHRQFKHRTKKGIVTVPGKMSADLAIGTEKSFFIQAGLEK